MNFLEILSSIWLILFYFKALSEGRKFNVIKARYIKEIPSHDQPPSLEEHPAANTEEKRLELCRSGLKQFQNFTARLSGKDGLSKGTDTGKLKVYVFEDQSVIRILPAYKCPTSELEIYINVDSNNENDNEPIFQVIHKKIIPRPFFNSVLYQMIRATDIVPVDPIDMISMSTGQWNVNLMLPAFDTDELSDEQRLQICLRGIETSPRMNIELMKNSMTTKNKFYKVKTFDRPLGGDYVMEMIECPTQPKIYVSVQRKSAFLPDIVLLWVIVKITDGESTTTGTETLKAVTGQKTAEALYHQTRNKYTNTKRDQFIDSRMQFQICDLIFRNDENRHTLYLSNNRNYHQLKNNHPNKWARVYKIKESEIISGEDILIVSGPESTDILVSEARENTPEDLFVCLVQDGAGSVEEYFFSKEYNINDTKDSSDDYTAARFIFKRSSNDNSAVLTSIIEELAKVLETSNVESYYLERKKKQDLAEANSENPLCKLESFEKFRVCTLVYEFLYTSLYTHGCALNPVTFVDNPNDNQYYESMMPCYESSGKYNKPVKIFYLAQVYDKSNSSSSNDVFVFSRTTHSAEFVLEKVYTDPRIGKLLHKK